MGKRWFAHGEFWDMTVPMLMMPPPLARTRYADWPFAVKSILGFWLFYALTIVVRAFLTADPWTMVENKLLYLGVGVIITIFMYLAIGAVGQDAPIRRKVVVAAISATVGALVMGGAVVALEDW